MGLEDQTKTVRPQDLFDVDEVLVTNSLMGAVQAISLDGKNLPGSSNLCEKITQEVL